MATSVTKAQQDQIAQLYVSLFNRAPDAGGFAGWVESLAKGTSLNVIAQDFYLSPEGQATYSRALTNQQFVEAFYTKFLGRNLTTEDKGGITYWVGRLGETGATHGAIAAEIIKNIVNYTGTDPVVLASKAIIDSKVAVGEHYALVLNGNVAGAAAAVDGVINATTAAAKIADLGTSGTIGSTFTLTTGADVAAIAGTAGNDTFNAVIDQATPANSTITAADVISGGAGNDVLNVAGVGTTLDVLGGALVSGIETINIRATTANTLNAAQVAGLTAVNSNLGAGTVGVTNLAAGASIGVIGNGTIVNGAVSFAYATASSDVTLNLAGGTKAGTTVTNSDAASAVTKATINSTGAANAIGALDLDGITATDSITSLVVNAASNLTATLTADDYAATAALTVSGAATSVDLGTAFDGKTIDASGMTAGGLTIATNTNLTSFKGGQGNDTVSTTALAAAAVAGAVDAGAGTADVLNVATATDVDTAAEAALFTNFEVLRNSGATDLDVSLLSGITSVQLNGANAGATKLTATQAANIKVLASNGTNTIALATATGTTDVLGLTLENLTAAAVATPIDVTAVTVTGFETLNVVSSSGVKAGGTGVGNDLAFAAAGDLTTINVSGAYDLTIASAGVTKVATVTSTQTGTAALYVSGDFAVGSSVTGSVGADAFVLGAVGTSYNGGAGNDTMSATQAQLNTGAVYSAVNGGDGTDTLNLTGGGAITIVDNVLSKVSGFEKIVIADTVANTQSITTGGWFDAAFKTSGVDLTTTAQGGTITIDMTSFTGAATILSTNGAATQSIQTGSGADKVTVVGGATNVISTFAGNDIIVGGAAVDTITGGAGADTINGGGGQDVYVFAAGDSNSTAMDSITGYLTTQQIDHTTLTVSQNSTAVTVVAGTAGLAGAGAAATFNAADNTLALRIVATEAALVSAAHTAGEAAHFQFGLDTYVFITDGVAGVGANDTIIKLVGIDSTNAAFDVLTIAGGNLTLA